MGGFKTFIMIIEVILSLGLISLVMLQTTKSEGLSGTIGGKSSSSFKGKPGMDDKLASLTKWTAIAWMVCGLIVYLAHAKMG